MEDLEAVKNGEFKSSAVILGTNSAIMVNGEVYGINITNEDNGIMATCPDLKDCFAIGSNRDAALDAIRVKIAKGECGEKIKVDDVKRSLGNYLEQIKATVKKDESKKQTTPNKRNPKPTNQPVYTITVNESQRTELMNHLLSRLNSLYADIETVKGLIEQIS